MKSLTRYRIIEISELLSGSVLPIIFWVLIIFGFDVPYVAILTILSAVIHELGHWAAISLLAGKDSEFRGHASGFRIKRTEALSYGKEISILLAGPLFNVTAFLLTLLCRDALYGYVRIFGYVNLATGLSNLLPLEGYDGYGALSQLFLARGRDELIQGLEIFSFIFSVCVTFISLYLIDRFSEGYWIFGVFFVMTLSKLVKFGKYDIFRE